MSLRLIGAGLPRTGTSSLRDALHQLLGEPIYHMSETFACPEHASTWVQAINGEAPDWKSFLSGYPAGVDAPFSNCWRELAAAFPDVPILLSRRDSAEQWYRSMEATVLPRTREILAGDDQDPMVPLFRVLFRGVSNDVGDPLQTMTGYERWLNDVRRDVEPRRLVEWHPSDGWEPICNALSLPVPDGPFPHQNSTAAYQARALERSRKDEARREQA